MQRIGSIIHCESSVKIMTTEGVLSGPLDVTVNGRYIYVRRDIDKGWTKCSRTDMSLQKVEEKISEWISDGPPRDQDDRVIPIEF